MRVKVVGSGRREVYFGEAQSGPSRLAVDGGPGGGRELDDWDAEQRDMREEKVDVEPTALQLANGKLGHVLRPEVFSTSRRPLRRPSKPGTSSGYHRYATTAMLCSLALLPSASSAPPASRPTYLSSSPTMSPPAKRGAVYSTTSNTAPTGLPTGIVPLNETALPYVLTQVGDGSWSKIDNAWVMYGRSAGVSPIALLCLFFTDFARAATGGGCGGKLHSHRDSGWEFVRYQLRRR